MYANLHNLYGTGIPVQTSRIEYISIIDQKKKIQITKGNAVKEFINGLIWFIYLTNIALNYNDTGFWGFGVLGFWV